MKIGIQISSDLKQRTGVEEYIYQLIKHLLMLKESKKHQIFLYSRENLKWPFKKGWTQIRLSLKMLKNRPDVLFIPAHTLPLIHPKLVVTIHGLEYEHLSKMYLPLRQKILRYLTKRNLKKADKVIVPSECTKRDLIKFYKADPGKIFVVYHGVNQNKKQNIKNKKQNIKNKKHKQKIKKYILYLGSGHKRKNVEGVIKAFKILKEKYKIKHELILAGVENYVSEKEKWGLLKNADVFVFPSFYEGFGFPVLEAQAAGIPVVASNVSSLPEILKDPSSNGASSALLVNPKNPDEIADAVYKIIKDEKLRTELIKRGYKNIKRFTWQKCARETLKILCA